MNDDALLARLESALGAHAAVEDLADELVAEAVAAARVEAAEIVKRLAVRALVERAVTVLEGAGDERLHVYGVARAGLVPPGGTAAVEANGLAAIVERVPAATYDDRARLERQVRRHDEVLRTASDVVPLRFGTVVEDEDAVAALLERDGPALTAVLERVAGRREWTVTVEPLDEPAVEGDGDGAGFLHDRLARRRAERAAEEVTPAVRAELAVVADAAIGDAYLVADADAFAAAVERLADRHGPRGVRLVLSGPWPPYSFVEVVA